jgi:pyridinium-3,5-bisthiocarboxylic acid mononucleotide nickel chelatase
MAGVTTLLLEPFGGIAGDMLLAALCDLGDPRFGLEDLRALAEELVPGEARLGLERVQRGGLVASHLTVLTPESANPPHRHLHQLEALLEASSLPPRARERAGAALMALAKAEARVHGQTVEQVHFHEVGAVDTLIDVGGAALALERLGIERVIAGPPLVGEGTVRCAHGTMPVPAPAVAELLRGRRLVFGGGIERTTPTGAAILRAWSEPLVPGMEFTGGALGYGAGSKDPAESPPNLLRVQLVEETPTTEARVEAWQMDVNLDDMSPEEVGHAVGALRAAGALEVWTSPAQMKKDRPGVVLSALCRAGDRGVLEQLSFRLTTTFGVRWTRLERRECPRRTLEVRVEGHTVRVKVRAGDGPLVAADLAPEHDDVARAADALGLALREVRRLAIEAALGC